MSPDKDFVRWFRASAPYIHAHRGRVFVIQLGGEAVLDEHFAGLVHDVALLVSLGVKVVVVHGNRPQLEERLAHRGIETRIVSGVRVTTAAALPAAIDAAGAVRTQIEALLSMGLTNSPMAGARIRVGSGNFVTARPIGVRDGVDFAHSGEVRRVDADAIRDRLHGGAVVLVSPLGYSPTGEVFNLRAEDVATEIAIELKAHKLLLLAEAAPAQEGGEPIRQMTLAQARALLQDSGATASEATQPLRHAVHACRNGVRRCHLLDHGVEGVLLIELFTRDGIGTLVSADPYDSTRRATVDDVGGIIELIAPLEAKGALMRRSREKLETEIGHFFVVERDGAIIACAAGYPFAEEQVAELACLAVDDAYRNEGRGDLLLAAVENDARSQGAARLFVLTTQAVHWFKEHGFEEAALEDLPVARQRLYNYERGSKVLIKRL